MKITIKSGDDVLNFDTGDKNTNAVITYDKSEVLGSPKSDNSMGIIRSSKDTASKLFRDHILTFFVPKRRISNTN